jgi:hypothetical protein
MKTLITNYELRITNYQSPITEVITKVAGLLIGGFGFMVVTSPYAIAQTTAKPINRPVLNYQITVNSNLDGEILPDRNLTLREAIAIANRTLTVERLSENERAQVKPFSNIKNSTISLDLPPNKTTIRLN